MKPAQPCDNYNHKRLRVPVRSCPSCGQIVNQDLPHKKCSPDEHAKKRRDRSHFCVDCGEQLIQGNR